MNEMSNREIAETLRTNESNVRTLQFRALKKLRVIIEDQERKIERRLQQSEEKQEKVSLIKRIW